MLMTENTTQREKNNTSSRSGLRGFDWLLLSFPSSRATPLDCILLTITNQNQRKKKKTFTATSLLVLCKIQFWMWRKSPLKKKEWNSSHGHKNFRNFCATIWDLSGVPNQHSNMWCWEQQKYSTWVLKNKTEIF